MAFFQVNFFSPTLCFNTDVNVIVPTPDSGETDGAGAYFHDGARYQVLYLLHGAYGDHSAWCRMTGIERYAQAHKLAVVMPSASNSFYQDMHRGSPYFTYLTEELPAFIQSLFPVSTRREDTFVAGLSMGGYGAVKLAFEKPERFAAAASLSGALDLVELMETAARDQDTLWRAVFADPGAVAGSDADLFALARKRLAEGRRLPLVYQTIGTEDFLYPSNVKARKKLEELGVELTYTEHPGIHDWNFWDAHIQDVLNWLPLANTTVTGEKEEG